MKKSIVIIYFLTLLLLASCTTIKTIPDFKGDMAQVVTHRGNEYKCELLFIKDSMIYIHIDYTKNDMVGTLYSRIRKIDLKNVIKIEIQGYTSNNWGIGVFALEILPALGLAVADESYNSGSFLPAFLISMVPAVINSMFFELSTIPAPNFVEPFTSDNIWELRRYTRYYKALDDNEIKIVLENYAQDEKKEPILELK